MTDMTTPNTTPAALAAELLPCPFCGAGATKMQENGCMWTSRGKSEPTSVSVVHWCEPVIGQPSRRIERVGRDKASAIAAWNTRADLASQAREAAEVPAGYVIVPVEPTFGMQDEGAESLKSTLNVGAWGEFGGVSLGDAESCYRAMIAASQKAEHK